MPRISAFYGIVIWMYHDEGPHPGRAHFHAEYGDEEASFDIETLSPSSAVCPGVPASSSSSGLSCTVTSCARTGIAPANTSHCRESTP
jgi:hypothetical protein